MASGTGGHIVYKSDNATGTETTAAAGLWDVQATTGMGIRPRRVIISNDGSIDLLYRFDLASDQMTLGAGETMTHETVAEGLFVKSASSCAYRAWGEG